MLLRTPLFGLNKHSPGLSKFQWPTDKQAIDTLHLAHGEIFTLDSVSYKESFGCLKAIGIATTGSPPHETPLFEAGRPDRVPVCTQLIDSTHTIT